VLKRSGYLKKLGAEVTVIEAQSSLLAGVVDPECAQVVARKADKAGIKVLYGAKAKGQTKTKSGYDVTVEINGKEEKISSHKIFDHPHRKYDLRHLPARSFLN
jgi:dihydrolipoamide dehydrogenase